MSTIVLTYTPKTRVCSCCGEEKPEYEFYKQSYTGILSNQCKECTKIKKSVVYHKAKVGKFISKERQRGMEEPDYSLKDWQEAMLFFRGSCCYCGCKEGKSKKDKFDKEHFIPVSQGGKTTRSNIAPACKKCNRGRGNKDLITWYRAQPFWTQEKENRIVKWMNQY